MCFPAVPLAAAAAGAAGTGAAVAATAATAATATAATSGIGAFLLSPGFSLFTTLASGAFSIFGQIQQGKAAEAEARYQQSILENQRIAAEQDIAAERTSEKLRQQLLTEQGRGQRGDIVVSQAALGQLVETGSAADITADLAGEVAFKKLISGHESQLRERNLKISADSISAESSLVGFRGKQASAAATRDAFGTVLSTGSVLTSKFKRGKSGDIRFRT